MPHNEEHSASQSLALRTSLLGPLAALEPLAAGGAEAGALLDLARTVRADAEADARAGRPIAPYLAHNVAVLLLGLAASDRDDDHLADLWRSAAPLLQGALAEDPDDLAIAAALLELGHLAPKERRPWLLDVGETAAASPLAGDRLFGAWARLLGALADDRDDDALGRRLETAVARLDGFLEQRPWNVGVAGARLRLVAAHAARSDAAARDEALTRFRALAADFEDRFGGSPEIEATRLDVALLRLQAKGAGDAARKEARELLVGLAAPGRLSDGELLRALRGAEKAGALQKPDWVALVEPLRSRSSTARAGDRGGLYKALRKALERAGDREALLEELVADVTRSPKSREPASALIQQALATIAQGDEPQIPAEALRAAAAAANRGAFGRLDDEQLGRWLDHLAARLGADGAAEHVTGQLVQVRELRKLTALWERGEALLRAAGREEEALDLLREGAEKGGHDALRLRWAEAMLAAERELPDVDDALKALAGSAGPLQQRARELRQKVSGHPALERQRREMLLEHEDEIGVGTDRALRVRVVYTGDGFALAEAVDHPAPPWYEHKHVRVMIRRGDLPGDLDLADLKKGRDVFARVRGEDDAKRKGGLRIYWVADGTTVDPGWSEDERLRRVTDLEGRFRIGTGASLALRVRKVVPRQGALWASIETPQRGGRETFPSDVRVLAGDLPDGVRINDLKAGDELFAPVDSLDAGSASPGDRRYRVRAPVEVVGRGGAEQPTREAPKGRRGPKEGPPPTPGSRSRESGRGPADGTAAGATTDKPAATAAKSTEAAAQGGATASKQTETAPQGGATAPGESAPAAPTWTAELTTAPAAPTAAPQTAAPATEPTAAPATEPTAAPATAPAGSADATSIEEAPSVPEDKTDG